mgnify:CR=1 FL=1
MKLAELADDHVSLEAESELDLELVRAMIDVMHHGGTITATPMKSKPIALDFYPPNRFRVIG